jgi:hypothetical protein
MLEENAMTEATGRHVVTEATPNEPNPVKREWQAPMLSLLGDAASLTAGGKLDATADGGGLS